VLKLLAGVAVVLALLVYLRHPHGANAAKVASCLEHGGAAVTPSRLFEESYTALVGGQQFPEQVRKKLHELDEHVYDVTIESDTGWLMDTKQARQAGDVERVAAEHGFDFTAQGGGKVVMLWTAGPSPASRSALDRCLP
jgi:hypothetical protein